MSALSRAILILALPAATSAAQSPTPRRAATSTKVAQVAGGAIAGSLVGLIAWKQYDDPYGPGRRVKGDAGYTPRANSAYVLGSIVGSTIAVQLIGTADGSRAPILATAFGTAVGTLPIAMGRDDPYIVLFGPILSPLQSGAGTFAYHKLRRVP